MTTALVEFRGVSAGYHGVPAISDLDLEVAAGEVVALLGANGAGKTTTIRAASGQIALLDGIVTIDSNPKPGALFRRARRGLGLLSEGRNVFSALTCRDNLKLGRGSIGDALSQFPELEPHLGTRAGLVSGGQQQMLALARILAAHPKIIFADEVSLGLAPMVVTRLLEALHAAARAGAAVLLVEQHAALALRTADRAYVLRRGRVELSGTSDELAGRSDELARLYL